MAKRTAPHTESVRSPIDACEEAAMRLNVVIRLLHGHDCAGAPAETPDEDEGGYDLSIAQGVLHDVRAMLQASAKGGA